MIIDIKRVTAVPIKNILTLKRDRIIVINYALFLS